MDLKNKKQTNKNKNFLQSLSHAWNGFEILIKHERNFRIHLSVTVLVLVLGLFLRVTFFKYMWLVLACFLVLVAEIINTLIEYLVDMVEGTTYSVLAKKIKDVAAGGVLLTAFFAVIIGLAIFIPALFAFF